MHELDADYSEGTSLCVHSPSYASPKSFLCFPAGAGHSYTISAFCCKVRVRNSFSISRLRTLSFSVSCNPCICHSYENCRVCTNNSHFETRRRDFRHRNEKLVPANPLESAFANCDTCKSSRMRFLRKLPGSLGSVDILYERRDASGDRGCRPGRATGLGGPGWPGCVRVRARRVCV